MYPVAQVQVVVYTAFLMVVQRTFPNLFIINCLTPPMQSLCREVVAGATIAEERLEQ